MILQIVNILAPGMFLALVGLIWHFKGPRFPTEFVTTLVLNVSMPALLFHTLSSSTVPIQSLGRMALATGLVHVIFAIAAIAYLKLSSKDWRLSVAHVVGNTGNLGLPVCFLAFGDQGLAFAMTFFSVQCILLFTFGEAIYAGKVSVKRVLQSPILHAIWLGVGVRALDLELPQVLLQTTELIGQIVIPLMLITLGVSLAGMKASQLPVTVFWSFVRTACAAFIGFMVAYLLNLEGVARGVLIIETVVPVAVFNYLLAMKHGRDSAEVSGLILVTHVMAIFYLPVVLTYVI